jgi:hypothetical protein
MFWKVWLTCNIAGGFDIEDGDTSRGDAAAVIPPLASEARIPSNASSPYSENTVMGVLLGVRDHSLSNIESDENT